MKLPLSRRLLVLGGVGLVCVLLSIGYAQFYLARPIGSGPAGPQVSASAFEKVWTDRPVLLLGVGDSITAGLGAKNPSHSYFERLFENPPDEYEELRGVCLTRVMPNLTKLNVAISGSTSLTHAEVVERLEAQPAETYGIVVMTTGGNDLIHSYGRAPAREGAMFTATLQEALPWIANFETRLAMMLDKLTEMFPGGCEIYLADIYDPTDGVGDGASIMLPPWPDGLAIHAQYNAVIKRCVASRSHVHVVPLHQTFLGHGGHCRQFWREFYDARDPYYWFHTNVEDPNDRGYDAIRRVFMNSILENSSLRLRD